MIFKIAARVAACCAAAALSVACFVDTSSSHGSGSSSGGTSAGPAQGEAPTNPPARVDPMLVDVDTGKTMAAAPGDGVGVFIEYAAGGKWHVWWTCDTNQTSQSCTFDVKISAETGTLESPTSESFSPKDSFVAPTPQTIVASTLTTTAVSGVTFTATPGAPIRLEAAVSGLQDSGFFFFVQGGKVNGGYQGKLTNPLLLRGTTP